MKIGAIIQARVSSSRLPGKILKELPMDSGVTVLEQVIRRIKRCRCIDRIVIATTKAKEDNAVVKIASGEKVKYFRGDAQDVLSRYFLAAKENSLDYVIRVTSDCPCIDPKMVDNFIARHLKARADYTCVSPEFTLPRGLNAEVINFKAIENAYYQAHIRYDREHVTPFIFKHPDIFKLNFLKIAPKFRRPDIRITIDRQEDYILLCAVFDYLYFGNKYFSATDIISLFDKKPWLKLINKNVLQKKELLSLKDELKEAVRLLKMQELNRAADICGESL